jgi:hypothetical protein
MNLQNVNATAAKSNSDVPLWRKYWIILAATAIAIAVVLIALIARPDRRTPHPSFIRDVEELAARPIVVDQRLRLAPGQKKDTVYRFY